MKTYSPYASKFYASILVSQLTKGMISVFCSRLSKACSQGPSATYDELNMLDGTIEKVRPRCVPEHEASGIAFLYNKVLTPTGALRCTEHSREFRANGQLMVQQAKRHPERYQIHLVGTRYTDDLMNASTTRLVPVYRLSEARPITPHRPPMWFEYCALPWQSGGQFIIVDRS